MISEGFLKLIFKICPLMINRKIPPFKFISDNTSKALGWLQQKYN